MKYVGVFDVSADMSVNTHVHTQLETLVTSALTSVTSVTSVTDTRDSDVCFNHRIQPLN